MMLTLVVNVIAGLLHKTRANRKGTIATLPFEVLVGRDFVRYQVGRSAFYLSDNVGEADAGRQTKEDVNVVFNATERNKIDAGFVTLRADGSMHALLDFSDEQGQPIPGRPGRMNKDRYSRLVHRNPLNLAGDEAA
ncbi:MAG: hypothetical protein U0841_20330 [Chloroflexia bacterium]